MSLGTVQIKGEPIDCQPELPDRLEHADIQPITALVAVQETSGPRNFIDLKPDVTYFPRGDDVHDRLLSEIRRADRVEKENRDLRFRLEHRESELKRYVAASIGSSFERRATPHQKDLVEELFTSGFTIVMFAQEVGNLAMKLVAQSELQYQPPPLDQVEEAPMSPPATEIDTPQPESKRRSIRREDNQVEVEAQLKSLKVAERQEVSNSKDSGMMPSQKELQSSASKKTTSKLSSKKRNQMTEIKQGTSDANQSIRSPPKKRQRSDAAASTAAISDENVESDLSISNHSRLEKIRKLVYRRNISRAAIMKGAGISKNKAAMFCNGNELLPDEDGAKIIEWYEKCGSNSFRFIKTHPAASEYLKSEFERGNYKNKDLPSSAERMTIAEKATEVVQKVMGDHYEDWAMVTSQNVYHFFKYREGLLRRKTETTKAPNNQ